MRGRVRGAALAIAMFAAAGLGRAADKPEIKRSPGTVRTTERPAARFLDVVRIDGVDYLDLQDIARLFRATKYWRAELGKMVLKVEGARVTLTVGSPFVYVEQQGHSLLAPVVWHEGRLFAPVALATSVLDPLVPEHVTWSRETRELRLVLGEPNLLRIECNDRDGGTFVDIALTEVLNGELSRPESTRVVVRVPGARPAVDVGTSMKGLGLVDSVEVAAEPDAAMLTFHLSPFAGPVDLASHAAPPRLELSIRSAAMPESEDGFGAFESVIEPGEIFRAPREVRVVVLDPGHGGSDKGVVSEGGLAEKAVTLEIARRAKALLEAAGMEVYLTREDDRFVSPEGRARVANQKRADVFVSLHANGWFDSDLSGFGVGVPKAHPREPGAMSVIGHWGERETENAQDSEMLAEMIASRLKDSIDRPNRGVRTADWAPLTGTTMAAVLVECGFLTNGGDAKKLAEPDFQGRVAKAVADALFQYRDTLARAGTTDSPVPEQETP